MTCGSGDKSSSLHGIFKCAIIIALVVVAAGTANAATITVPAGGNLQSAINAAQPGDTIVLEAGATYTGDFILPNKSGSTYITIQSSRVAELPEGVRVGPAQSALFAKLHSASSASPIVRTAAGSHHYRLVGLEITTPTTALVYDLVRIGEWFQSSTEVPHSIVIDRSYIHGHPTQDVQRGIALNGAAVTISNSYISEIHMRGIEAQAICGWNGPGPFSIINNYLEGAGENIMFGGGDPSIPNLIPSNIEIRRNHLFKPLSWKIGDPSYKGIHWGVKNILELKMGRNVVIDGNVLENCWIDGQIGYAVLFTVRNQDGKAPWAVLENVRFTNNIVKNSEQGFQLLGEDAVQLAPRSSGLLIANNLLIDIRNRFLTMSAYDGVTISHNTHFQNGNLMSLYGKSSNGFVYTDNLTNRVENSYGIFGDGVGEGNPALTMYTPAAVVQKNLIAGAPGWIYPTNNFYPSSLSGVLDSSYRVIHSSYKAAGTDGKDIGCDITALMAAQQTSTPEVMPSPTPTPSVSPTPTPSPSATPTPTPSPSASPTPTPTPTPAPSPSPTPSPSPGGNALPQVLLTVPNGSRFVAGSDVTIAATAADSDGTVSKVEFYRGTTLMGTDTTSPYSVVWSAPAKGTYDLTARATDNKGGSATSAVVSVTVTSSPNSVNKAKGRANNLVQQTEAVYAGAADTIITENATLAADITGLTAEITLAYSDFLAESHLFGSSAPAIDAQINAAALFSKASAGLSLRAASSPNIKNNLLRVATHLAIAEDLMRYGLITHITMEQAIATRTRTSVVIGQASTGYALTSTSPIAPASIGSIAGNTQPMTSQTALASLQSDGTLPYEVGGLSVTVNGVAVPVLYASPFGIRFVMPPDMQLGTVEVLISSQDGYICKGSATVQRTAAKIMTVTEDENGTAIAANGMKLTASTFQVVTPENLGSDKRTRLTFFANGLSGSAFNTDTRNDVSVDGVIKPNFAESIRVEARTRNNKVFVLPVEFAGAQGILTGMDQITVILVPELKGVGRVQLTLIVNGQRSNAPAVEIR